MPNFPHYTAAAVLMIIVPAFFCLQPDVHADTAPLSDQQERATRAIEQDLKTDPNNSELWVHLGFGYRKLNRIEESRNAFEKAVALNPKNTEASYMLALIYESKRQTPEALKAWKNYLAAETDAAKRSIAENHIHHLSQ